jgi:hypothetical protein
MANSFWRRGGHRAAGHLLPRPGRVIRTRGPSLQPAGALREVNPLPAGIKDIRLG